YRRACVLCRRGFLPGPAARLSQQIVICNIGRHWVSLPTSVRLLKRGRKSEGQRSRNLSYAPAVIAVDPPRDKALREDRVRPFSAVYDNQPTADSDLHPLHAQDVAPLSRLEITPQALNHPAAFPQDGLVLTLRHDRPQTGYSSAFVRQPAPPQAFAGRHAVM